MRTEGLWPSAPNAVAHIMYLAKSSALGYSICEWDCQKYQVKPSTTMTQRVTR